MIAAQHARMDGRTNVVVAETERDKRAKKAARIVEVSPARAKRLVALLMALPGSAEATQKARVRMALEGGPVTTCELRRYCDILHPAGRVKSLRDAGAEIATTWVKQRTESGHLHCVGEYSLMRAPA